MVILHLRGEIFWRGWWRGIFRRLPHRRDVEWGNAHCRRTLWRFLFGFPGAAWRRLWHRFLPRGHRTCNHSVSGSTGCVGGTRHIGLSKTHWGEIVGLESWGHIVIQCGPRASSRAASKGINARRDCETPVAVRPNPGRMHPLVSAMVLPEWMRMPVKFGTFRKMGKRRLNRGEWVTSTRYRP